MGYSMWRKKNLCVKGCVDACRRHIVNFHYILNFTVQYKEFCPARFIFYFIL